MPAPVDGPMIRARVPRPIHALILLTTSGLAAMVTSVLGPIVPKMQQHFSAVANADYWVPLTLTAPMLIMASLSVFAGALSDRVGRKRLLVWATACYAVFGTAPLYLDSLSALIASRIGLGIVEATLMTTSTAMIGDYYDGAQRERYMALSVTLAGGLSFVFNVLSGMLGEYGWRVPFAIYGLGAPLALMMATYLFEPLSYAAASAAQALAHGHGPGRPAAVADVPFQPKRLAASCVLACICGVSFLIVPVHLGLLFAAVGVHSSTQIGLAFALNSLGVIAGTLTFGWIVAPRFSVAAQVALCFGLSGVSCLMMMYTASYGALTSAAVVNGFCCGLMLPTLVTWNMRELPFSRRGFGTGAFQSSLYLGMFCNPLVLVRLDNVFHSRFQAVGVVGMVLVAIGAGALAVALPHPVRQPAT